eukprot:8091337-Ditylum_brightwellii.AAC.1
MTAATNNNNTTAKYSTGSTHHSHHQLSKHFPSLGLGQNIGKIPSPFCLQRMNNASCHSFTGHIVREKEV